MRYDVFVSYRRSGGEHTAKLIRDSLTERGYNVFFDVESLRSGQFNTKLYSVIEECKDFVIVLSPGALDRCADEADWVRREIEHALKTNKNIIPILLRDFTFPKKLPISIEKLPYMNGIEANSQFFDAFISKLQTFLSSKPRLFRSAKKMALAVAAFSFIVLAVIGTVFGIKHIVNTENVYPKTAAEKNLAYETVSLVGTYLTNINLITTYVEDVLDSAERGLLSGGENKVIDVKKKSIKSIDETLGKPDSVFLERLADSPFVSADLKALYQSVSDTKSEWLENIEYIEFLLSNENMVSTDDKLTVIECYRTFLTESVQIYAYGVNELLLPITDSKMLDSFFEDTLVYLPHIPLNRATWYTDKEIIKNLVDEAFSRYEEAYDKYAVIVGNQNVEYNEQLKSFYNICLPTEDDTAETLWLKLTAVLTIDCFDEARTLADIYFETVKNTDAFAPFYKETLYAFITAAENGEAIYGPMVVAYADTANECFEIGDIVVSFNGQPITMFDEYVTLKGALKADTYTVECLRLVNGKFEKYTLALSKDMPLVAFNDLMF